MVQAGGGHGDGGGAAYVDADYAGAELYVVGGEGAGGEGGELVATVALGEPEGVVAEGVGELAALDDFEGGHVLAAEAYAEFGCHGGVIISESGDGHALPDGRQAWAALRSYFESLSTSGPTPADESWLGGRNDETRGGEVTEGGWVG